MTIRIWKTIFSAITICYFCQEMWIVFYRIVDSYGIIILRTICYLNKISNIVVCIKFEFFAIRISNCNFVKIIIAITVFRNWSASSISDVVCSCYFVIFKIKVFTFTIFPQINSWFFIISKCTVIIYSCVFSKSDIIDIVHRIENSLNWNRCYFTI